ncbi:caldesmon-like isoform X8 [Mizuhopecten yessoensis]|uniref:caldesmon-like isoform X8 n=1 Tax=Mizuhopecten yessoensis TaxID=6573 RepID=UPI000B45B1D3|nr:caldesmon-like isoform X8 [Mizuhopecten yessoensis]
MVFAVPPPEGGDPEKIQLQQTETNTKGAEDQGSSVDPVPNESRRDSDNKNEKKKEVKFLDQCTPIEAETTKVVKEETPMTSPTIIISAAPPEPEEEEEQIVMEVVKETETEVKIGEDFEVTDQEVVKETEVNVSEIKDEAKVEVETPAVVVASVKKSEQIIPDENIEDEVFESETEHTQKIEADSVTKEDTVPSEEAVVSKDAMIVQVTNDQVIVAETREEEQTVSVAVQESPAKEEVAISPEVCVETVVEDSTVEEPIVMEKSLSVEVQPDPKVTEVVESIVETVVPVESPSHNTEERMRQEDTPPVQQQNQEVVITADEDIHEVVKGEIILPVVVTNEEAENQPKDQAEAGPSSVAEHKEEEVKVDKNELKKQEKERKQKEKERIKKEKEEKKKEKEEQKRLEKERKKKEKDEKEEQKRLEKEKKKKEKEEKKAKADGATTEKKEEEGENKEEEKEETEVKVDPVQIELAAALEQRRGKEEEEEVTEDKEETKEHIGDQAPAVATTSEVVAEETVQETKDEKEEVEIVTETKKDKKAKKEKKKKKEKKEKPKKEDKKKDSTTGCFSFIGANKADSDQEEVEEAPAEEMPTEPLVTVEQQEPEEPKPEETDEAKVSPQQRGVGLGWALPGFAEMKERQAAAAAKPIESDKPRSMSTSSAKSSSSSSASSSEGEHFPHEPRAPLAEFSEGLSTEGGLDAEGTGGDTSLGNWPYGKEGSIDRRMQFMPVTAPSTEEQSETRQKQSTEDTSMPFFDPASATNDSEGEGTLGKKVPPPVAPKSARLSQMAEEERQRQKEEEDRRLQLEEERLASLPPTVATESRKYDPETEETPIATTNVPIVKTETRTVTYEKDGVPVAIEDITLISSQSHSTRTQLSETTTYRAETNGIVETRMEKKVIITEDGDDDIDHDALLAAAIRSVTDMDPNLSVERIEYTKQVDNPSGDTQV